MKRSLSRRAVLQAVVLCVPAGAAGWNTGAEAAASDVSIDAFMALSSKLTLQDDLDGAMGSAILEGFRAAGKTAALAELISGGGPEPVRRKTGNEVVAAWYSGFSPDPQALEVAGFNSALVWSALSYTKPWANCGGETGYWGSSAQRLGVAITMSDQLSTDVAIIGSGVAGALVAAQLSKAGVKVTILEAGGTVDRGEAVERYWRAAIKVPECSYPAVPHAMHPVSNELGAWYQQQGPDTFSSTYVKVVGGTTWHWLGTALRFVPADFQLKSLYGQGEDWPVSYAELAAYYDRAEAELGVAGDSTSDLGSPRSAAYPMPAIPQTYLDHQFVKALQGTIYDVRATPQARNSQDREDRPACCGNASCIPVCPVQAKYDATVHVAEALAAGAVLMDKTTAVTLVTDAANRISVIHFKRLGWERGGRAGPHRGAGGACNRKPAAAAQFRQRKDAEWRRQQLRPGGPQSHGSPHAALMGIGQGAGLPLSRSAVDLRYRELAGWHLPV